MEPIAEFSIPAHGIKIKVEVESKQAAIAKTYETTFMDAVAELFFWRVGFDDWQLRKEFAADQLITISGQKMVGVQTRAYDRHFTNNPYPLPE